MKGSGFKIKDYIIAILLAVVFILSASVLMLMNRSAEEVPAETYETPASIPTETSIETEPSSELNHGLLEDMESGMSFCFVGDSITRGSVTDDIPWYEPMKPFIRGEIMNFSEGGWTSTWLVDLRDEVPVADVYVVAIGINDVLYIDQPLGAASLEEFMENLRIFTDALKARSPDAKFYYITPWPFLNFPEETYELCAEFRTAMAEWCREEGFVCIDPFDTILQVLLESDPSVYMWNDYHPNAPQGIGLYSYAVMQESNITS